MIQELPKNALNRQILTAENTYQYGPMCVERAFRGKQVFESVFFASLANMASRFPTMVTFVNQINRRSYAAHTRKAAMTTVGTFHYNNNDYYMLACPTKAL